MLWGAGGANVRHMDIANVDMAREWDGEEGDDWTENADRYDATDRYIWEQFRAKVTVLADDDVLDIGCGTGKSTRDMARAAPRGRVLGIDLSSRMLADARRRTDQEGLANVEYVQGDAQVHPFDAGAYDVAISSFGAMFFAGPVAAFANILRAVRPGGRLAMVAWRPAADNEWLCELFAALSAGRDLPLPPAGMPGPFGLADRDAAHRHLVDAGWRDIDVTALDAPMWVGTDAGDACGFVFGMGIVRGLTSGLDEAARQQALDRLQAVIVAHESSEGVLLGAGEWLITART